jgi:hypothetical protein
VNSAELIDEAPFQAGCTSSAANGEWRIMFVEDRFKAIGYATRNAVHWPLSILPSSAL